MAAFFNATRSPKAALHVGKRLLRHGRDLLLHRRGLQLVNGNALVARLLRSALDLGVTLLTDKPASRLLGEGRVSGALFADGQVIHARRGVVLACGGFPHDRQRIAQLMPHAPGGDQHYSAAPRKTAETVCALANRPVAWYPPLRSIVARGHLCRGCRDAMAVSVISRT